MVDVSDIERGQTIENITPDQIMTGEDIIVAVAKPIEVTGEDGEDVPEEDEFYAIGLLQSGGENDARPITEMGELGSSKQYLAVGENQKSARFNRLEVVGKNMLYAWYYPILGYGGGDAPFKPLSGAIADTYETPIEEDISQDDLFGGHNVLFGVWGPDENPSMDNMRVISLVQSFTVRSNNNVSQIPELGTTGKYIKGSKGTKSFTINRMVTENANIIRALYPKDDYPNDEHDHTNYILDLDSSLTNKSITAGLVVIDKDGNSIAGLILNNAIIQNIGSQFTHNDVGMVENMVMKWGSTGYLIDGETYATDHDVVKHRMPLCLDHDVFRNPIHAKLVYLQKTSDGTRDVIAKRLLKNTMINDIEFTWTAGSLFSVGGLSISWEKTENEDVTGEE